MLQLKAFPLNALLAGLMSRLAVIALLSISQLSCAAPQSGGAEIIPFPSGGTAVQTSPGYTLETPIEVIAADPRGAAVLNKDIPGLLANPNYEMFKGMGLKLLAALSSGKLSDQTLAQIKADLAALPK
jgi:hypothetical protein